ncbi:PAS domain S-box protein [Methanospirillum stamsii]|uniref:histidine kinase n=1 Tax=Methanospirillum stamsii TaxID=1277351 RepID=A0A2V2NC16_9EURY|nr:PAS domain S-box protein [Methanospirillum stamsii]PWR73121.1 hypothetical protein DLD82_11110 [Methanospirillum stamsii]
MFQHLPLSIAAYEYIGESLLIKYYVAPYIWEIDLTGVFSYVSPRCEDIVGYSSDELVGSSFFSILHPDGQQLLQNYFNNVSNRKPGLATFDVPAVHKDGSYKILNCRSYPLINSSGVITGFRGVTSDVTERMQHIRALHESETRLRSFFEATSEAVSLIDEDGIVIEWNPASERIFGIRKEDAIGMTAWDLMIQLIPPEDKDENTLNHITKSFKSALTTGVAGFKGPRIFNAISIDGRRLITRKTVFLMKTDKGYRFGAISQDITEEKNMAEALRDNEERFRGMAERSPDLIIILDKERNISYVSPSAKTIIGYTPEELIGRSVDSACAPVFSNDLPNCEDIIQKITGAVPTENEELQIFKKDGTGIFVNLYAIPIIRDGIVSGTQISMRDITQNKLIEQQLRISEEKFVTLFKGNPIPLTLVSAGTGFFTDVNDAFLQNSGYNREEVIGKSPSELNIFVNESEFAEFSKDIRENYHVRGRELKCRTKDGEIKTCRFSSSIIMIQGMPQILSSVEDITKEKQNEAAMREREERYRLIMKNAHEGIMMNELTSHGPGTFYDANESALKILGMSDEELKNKRLIDLDTPEMKARAPAMMRKITKTGHAAFQTHYIAPDNQEKIIDISVSLFDLNQVPTMLSIIRDITEEKAAESAINAMVTGLVGATGIKSLDRIVSSISTWLFADCVMIGELSPDRKYVKALSMIFEGKKIDNFTFRLEGTPCVDTISEGFAFYPDNVTEVYPEIRAIINRDFRGYIGAPLKNSEGDIIGVLCILSYSPINPGISVQEIIDIIAGKAGADIERSQIERVLIENEKRLAETMEMANLVSWEYDIASQLFTLNDRFYAMYGTTAEREGGYEMTAERYTREFVYPSDIQKLLEEARRTLEASDPDFISDFEHQIIRRDGEVRNISVRVRAVFDEHGNLVKTHGANQDITERKIIEEAVLNANRQLNLLSSITRHDILNKISVFYGYLRLLEMESDNPAILEYVQKMTEVIKKIQTQIEFSRVYQDLGSQKPLWFSLSSILPISSVPDTVHFSDNTSGISLFSDPMLERVFYNLLDNSIRHGEHVTEISVFSQERNKSLTIIYEDNGVGILPEEKERIFERGYGKNTGHGLFLVREILSLTNITIKETGTYGKGARFEIVVPSGSYRITQ